MLIKINELQSNLNVSPNGVLHVGAHLAEEAQEYSKYGWGNVVWVESQPEKVANISKLLDKKTNTIIEATVWSESGVSMDFNVASNGESSSVLEFGSHAKSYPNITYTKKIRVTTKRLDELIPEDFSGDFLNLDVQGAELEALKGLGSEIRKFKWIYSEINKEEVYKGCATVGEMDEYLLSKGYRRAVSRWILGAGWGDALYMRLDLKKQSLLQSIVQQSNNGLFYGIQLLAILKRKVINRQLLL